jgi:hypothetical protein
MNTKMIQKLGQTMVKNSPTILTGMSVAGLVTTLVMGSQASIKAYQLVKEEEVTDSGYRIDLEPFDIVKLTWKCYIPTAIAGTFTIACIISANSINLKRNAALAGLYSLADTSLKEYQAKVVETIGKNKEREIRDAVYKDEIDRNPVNDCEVIQTGRGNFLCYDALSGRYFRSDIEQIRQSINNVNRSMLSDMFIPLNDVYYALDLKGTKMGDLIGWHVDDGLIEPEFSSQLTETGEPCLVMDFNSEPRYAYND